MNKKICVVGAGQWGKNHINTLSELGYLRGVVDSNKEELETILSQYKDVNIHESLDDALNQDYDGFTVATPAETHYDIAKTIIQKGKHLLVEKPLSLKLSEAKELVGLAKDAKVNLMVGHLLLFHPAIRKIKEILDSGKIGKLQYIYSNRLNLGTVRTEENILWSFAPHDISIFGYLTNNQPVEVISRGGAYTQSHLHDTTMTILKYPENVVGHIFVSWLHPFKEHRLVLIGSKGMLSYTDSDADKDIKFYEKGIDIVDGVPIKRDGPTTSISYDEGMPLLNELKYFADHLNGTPVETSDGKNALEVLEVLERAQASLTDNDKSIGESRTNDLNEKAFVHPSSYVDEGCVLGKGTKIWYFSHVQSNSVIGENCSIGQNVNIGSNVKIGNNVKIQNNVSVYEGVELEDFVFCGPSMVFTNISDPRSKYPQRGAEYYKKTLVREGASLGANSTIVCGNTIGKHSFVGAGAVVTKDVPDYALMVGVPATRAGWVCECGNRLTVQDTKLECKNCKRKYRFLDQKQESINEATN
ncbi:oxidoreductase [Candidatus Marinimicrobia bacterium MT.SAG.4]|nr:oxidoreductase [Candidatus Marinimicrobia bacterium MT.SAG.4]